jgi:UrcA family protein
LIHQPDIQESNMNTMTTNTSTRSTRAHGLIAGAIITALISSFSAVCNAADDADVPKAIVKYADLDISTSQGAATLFGRIRAASAGVCSPLAHGDFLTTFRWEQCVKQATAGAVAKVNEPTLSAIYAAKYGMPHTANILTADRR